MQSYYVHALGQLCDERSDELAKAYQQAQRPARRHDAPAASLKRLIARMRELNRAAASRA